MKVSLLTASEIAAALRLSVVSVRRAYIKGDIPVVRFGRSVRFNLEEVLQAKRRHGGPDTLETPPAMIAARAAGGTRRRRAEPDSPRSVKRGRNFQSSPRRNA